MNPLTDQDVIAAMHKYGGSFVKALAKAADVADPENLSRIQWAWPELWEKYSELAEMEISQNKPTTEPNPCQTLAS